MRRTLIVFVFLALQWCPSAFAVETDKVAHFAVSYGASLTIAQLCKKACIGDDCSWYCPIVGGFLGMVPGTVKEFTDSRFDWGDMGANAMGCGSATLINLTFDF